MKKLSKRKQLALDRIQKFSNSSLFEEVISEATSLSDEYSDSYDFFFVSCGVDELRVRLERIGFFDA